MLGGTSHQPRREAVDQRIERRTAAVEVGVPAVSAGVLQSLRGLNEIRASLETLRAAPTQDLEESFHRLETAFIKANGEEILKQAAAVNCDLQRLMERARSGWDELHHFRFEPRHAFEDALVYRYVYMPLAYRLGYYTLAAKLAQMTFERLLPDLEERVRRSTARLAGRSAAEAQALAHEHFTNGAPADFCYSRPKTPHSIWKKAGSAAALEGMSSEVFAERTDDYIGVAWTMRPREGENRFDAIVRAAREFCGRPELLATAVRHRCDMGEGFPVVMVHCRWRGLPVEVQFLGGDVLGWLAAMDYGMYKLGTSLDGIEKKLSPEEWARRGNAMLCMYEEPAVDAYEEGFRAEYHRILLEEVTAGRADYGARTPKVPAWSARPRLVENQAFVWPGDEGTFAQGSEVLEQI